MLQLLIDHGAVIDYKDGLFANALHTASSEGHEKVVQLLIDNGADFNAQNEVYSTSLLAASRAGHESVVQLLVENGAMSLENGITN